MTPARSEWGSRTARPSAGTCCKPIQAHKSRSDSSRAQRSKNSRRSIRENRAEELLNWINVSAGEMLYVAAGTVHTIGGGMILVETQQSSDITYRLYDYERPRELHIKDGIAAMKLDSKAGKVVAQWERSERAGAVAVFSGREDEAARTAAGFGIARVAAHRRRDRAAPESSSPPVWSPSVLPRAKPWWFPLVCRTIQCRPQWELEVMRMSLPTGKRCRTTDGAWIIDRSLSGAD